jgi:hypothetical protein
VIKQKLRSENVRTRTRTSHRSCFSIFCHLGARKISKCTKVSRDWNNFIKSSTKFMDKFQIKLNGYHLSFLKRANEVLQSNRNCYNIRIENFTTFMPIVDDIMAAKSGSMCTLITFTSQQPRSSSNFSTPSRQPSNVLRCVKLLFPLRTTPNWT